MLVMAADNGLSDRIQQVMDEQKLSAREWSLRAGLSQSMVGQLRRGELSGKSWPTIVALAKAVGVNDLWLARGIGPKTGGERVERVERSVRYPNLERAIDYWAAKDPAKWSRAAIDAVRATANHETNDLSITDWEARLSAMTALLSGRRTLPAEAESDEPPRNRRAKK